MVTVDVIIHAAKYAAFITISYGLLVLIYRVFLHPLRKFPGPLAAKLSDLYAGFHAVLMRLHLATFLDQMKYGPVMRHGPNKLIFNSAQALQDIYNNERLTKSHVYLLTVSAGKPSIFNTIDRRQHRNKRRLIGQAVNDKAMRDFEPTMKEQVDIFLGQLLQSAQSSTPVDMSDRCKRLGMDIVGFLSFGFALNMQTEPTYRFIIRGTNTGGYRSHCYMQFPALKELGIHYLLLILGLPQRLKYIKMLQHMISTRLSEEKHARNDLYSFVADHIDNSADGITTSELWSEALFFFPAGGETISTAMSALFFYLSRNPVVYQKLADEIRSTFASSAEIRGGSKLSSCRYLRACIDEALRMSPPVSGTPWRELYADERDRGPLIVDGHVVPPGTQVGVCVYSLHHNEKYFSDPFTFSPERWLVEDEATLGLMNSAFCAFSIGGRGCAGKSMAYLEASLVIAKTLWYFDFEKAPGKVGETGAGAPWKREGRKRTDEFQLYDIFSSMHAGPNLVFKPRGDLCKEIEG